MELISFASNGNAKEFSNQLADQVIASVMDNGSNALKQIIMVKALDSALTKIKAKLMPYAIEDFDTENAKEIDMNGYRISKVNTGVSYDFSNCNHPVYNALYNQLADIKSQMDDIEKMLKSLTSSMEILDKETGEVYTIYPPVKKSTTTLKLS